MTRGLATCLNLPSLRVGSTSFAFFFAIQIIFRWEQRLGSAMSLMAASRLLAELGSGAGRYVFRPLTP